jgi:hypothetical protein
MRISQNWPTFLRHFRRAFPGEGGVQEELDLDI